ncbi:hypothetical protein FJZ48_01265 [Candidatus Uhrbacteria bacterium]|nr:hypothetical protein [Candidatus Uhrbacteria bacterium]
MNKQVLAILAVIVTFFTGWYVLSSVPSQRVNQESCVKNPASSNKNPQMITAAAATMYVDTKVEIVNKNVRTSVRVLPKK